MGPAPRRDDGHPLEDRPRGCWAGRVRRALALLLLALTQVPTVAAHEAHVGGLSHGHSILVILAGGGFIGGAVMLKRRGHISPTRGLSIALTGLALAVFGVILFDGLAPEPTYGASTIPFPRAWYPFIALSVGLAITLASVVLGWTRWPTRPRYPCLGMLMGSWIAYPALLPGAASYTHPLGYALVLGTPILVGYILWTDARGELRIVVRDRVARRFGMGVGGLVGLFFLSTSGYLTVFWEKGAPTEPTVVVLPATYQLVTWPTLEIALPDVPLFIALSVGIVMIVGLLSVLVGLNASLIAYQWRNGASAGVTEGSVGTGAIVGSCTCGCCGPLVAKVAVLAAGPSVAAPLYWVFVDTASPLSTLFIVGSIVLFTGTLIYAVAAARRPAHARSIATTDWFRCDIGAPVRVARPKPPPALALTDGDRQSGRRRRNR